MKKKNVILCMALVLQSVTTFADPLIDGDLRVRTENMGKTDLTSDRAETLLRVRPKLTWQPNDTTTVVLQIQATKAMGEPTYTPTSSTSSTQQQTSGASSNGDTPITFHQAYGIYQPLEWFQLMAGRQVLSYGDELVVGEADWNNISRSFDAVRMRAKYAFGWTDVFTAKIIDTNTTGPGPGDKDFHGLYNGWNFGSYLNQFDFYVFDLHDSTVNPTADLIAVGARVESKINQFDYRAEWTQESESTFGNQADGEFGYTLDSTLRPRLSVEYFYASSDYNQLFPTAHKWLGFADVLGRRNVQGYAGHLSSGVSRWMNVQVDYQIFARVDKTRAAYKLNGTSALGSGAASSSSDIGRELDLTVKMKASSSVGFALGVSQFFSGPYLKDQFGDINPNFCYAQMDIKF